MQSFRSKKRVRTPRWCTSSVRSTQARTSLRAVPTCAAARRCSRPARASLRRNAACWQRSASRAWTCIDGPSWRCFRAATSWSTSRRRPGRDEFATRIGTRSPHRCERWARRRATIRRLPDDSRVVRSRACGRTARVRCDRNDRWIVGRENATVTPAAVAALGEPGVVVHGLRVKPGKPTLLGAAGGKPILGLPGNPISALMMLEAVGAPIVARAVRRAPAGIFHRRALGRASARASRLDVVRSGRRCGMRAGPCWRIPCPCARFR